MPDAYQLPNGLTIHQDSSQRWCDPTGFPLAIAPDLDDATPLWYSETDPNRVSSIVSVPLTEEAKARKAKERAKFWDSVTDA